MTINEGNINHHSNFLSMMKASRRDHVINNYHLLTNLHLTNCCKRRRNDQCCHICYKSVTKHGLILTTSAVNPPKGALDTTACGGIEMACGGNEMEYGGNEMECGGIEMLYVGKDN